MITVMGASMDKSVLAFSKEEFLEKLKPLFGKHTERAYNELHGITTNSIEESPKEIKDNTEDECTSNPESVQIKRGKRKDN